MSKRMQTNPRKRLFWPVFGSVVIALTVAAAIWGLRWSTPAAQAPAVARILPERRVAEDATTLFPSLLPTADLSALPDLSEPEEVQARKQAFYDFMLPLIAVENERLLIKRAYLEDWLARLEQGTQADAGLLA
jgi:hypothetical protein